MRPGDTEPSSSGRRSQQGACIVDQVGACAVCGDDKSMLQLLAKKEKLRKKWLDWTLPLLCLRVPHRRQGTVGVWEPQRRCPKTALLSVFNEPETPKVPSGSLSLSFSLSVSLVFTLSLSFSLCLSRFHSLSLSFSLSVSLALVLPLSVCL